MRPNLTIHGRWPETLCRMLRQWGQERICHKNLLRLFSLFPTRRNTVNKIVANVEARGCRILRKRSLHATNELYTRINVACRVCLTGILWYGLVPATVLISSQVFARLSHHGVMLSDCRYLGCLFPYVIV